MDLTGVPTLCEIATKQAFELHPDEQFELATKVARNLGYKLVPEGTIQEAEDRDDILRRLDRLEDAVLELNPGLNWLD